LLLLLLAAEGKLEPILNVASPIAIIVFFIILLLFTVLFSTKIAGFTLN
jgi:hypothetical protein